MKILGTRMVDKVFAAECAHKVLQKMNEMSQNIQTMPILQTPAVAVQWSGMGAELRSPSWRQQERETNLSTFSWYLEKSVKMFLTKAIKPVVTVSVTVNLSVSVSL